MNNVQYPIIHTWYVTAWFFLKSLVSVWRRPAEFVSRVFLHYQTCVQPEMWMIYYMTSLVWLIFALHLNQMSHQTMFLTRHPRKIRTRNQTKFQYISMPYVHVIVLCRMYTFLLPHCIIITQHVFQSSPSLVYHAPTSRSLWIIIFVRVRLKSQFTIGFSYDPLLKTHSNQEHDNAYICPPFPESIEQLIEQIIHSVPMRRLSDSEFVLHVYFSGWVLGGDCGFAPALDFVW